MNEHIIAATDETFKSILEGEKLIMVDFWATWCGPCRMLAPWIDELATEFADDLTVVKVNVDECDTTAEAYGIVSIPTLTLFKDGKELETIIGYRNKDQLVSIVNKHLNA